MNVSISNLNSIKDQVIEYLVETMILKREITEDERFTKRKEIEEKIKSNTLLTQNRLQTEVTDSLSYNATNEELYLDLLTLFKYVNEVEKNLSKHTELNFSSLKTIENTVGVLEEQIESLERILMNRNLTFFHIESFNTSNNASVTSNDYTERYGEVVSIENHALINPAEKTLTLPYLHQYNMMAYNDSILMGTVEMKKQICNAFSYSQAFSKDLNKLLDTSTQTFWSDTLFVDQPIEVKFPSEVTNGLDQFYYGIQNGALFELDFHFESVVRLNEILIKPYLQYPLDLVAIRYTSSDELTEMKEIIKPNHEDTYYQSRIVDGDLSFRFPEINCKHLYLIFNQRHFVKETFLLNSADLFKNNLWNQLHESEYQYTTIPNEVIFKPVYLNQIKKYPELAYLQELQEKNQTLSLERFLKTGNENAQLMTKYQYQYGFYNISPNYVQFQEAGIFVSKEIQLEGNIKALRLTVDQTLASHQGVCLTDVEYYLSCSTNLLEKWQPILPQNISVIECERLQLGENYCELRFPATQILSVRYQNETLVEGVHYELVIENDHIVGLDIPSFQLEQPYTVSYSPVSAAYEVNLVEDENPVLFNKLETIPGTNRSYYELKEYPFLSDEGTTTLKIIDKETGTVLTQEVGEIECLTDLSDPANSFKRFNYNTSKFQYYVHKNCIYFNQIVTEQFDIEINYQHFISSFQVKAILRRNTLEHQWMTPVVHQIKVETLLLNY
ncbi:MAG: hypothetical protein IIZ99_01950 [Turicibacter sp.]|nr:hypothetical protein [Turicibacter sp.]